MGENVTLFLIPGRQAGRQADGGAGEGAEGGALVQEGK